MLTLTCRPSVEGIEQQDCKEDEDYALYKGLPVALPPQVTLVPRGLQ